jgi:AcrR family transcriptional regulator
MSFGIAAALTRDNRFLPYRRPRRYSPGTPMATSSTSPITRTRARLAPGHERLDPRRASAILRATDALARKGGADAVHMKAVAEAADVAIATLYRYFPSKGHLLIALYNRRLERLLEDTTRRPVPGDTPGVRVRNVLMYEMRLAQREHLLAEAVLSSVNGADRSASEDLGTAHRLHLEVLRQAAGEELDPRRAPLLEVAAAVWGQEVTGWLRGLRSADNVATQIELAARLIDDASV